MLISDSHEFIFFHNYKVAGSSIKHALKPHAQSAFERLGWVQRQFVRLRLREIPHYPHHLTAREIRNDHPEEWHRYFTFGFVRNPWAWQVSLYFFMLESEDHHQHDLIASMEGFDEYIHWRVNEDKNLQSEFFCDADGRVLVDYIGRLESILEDFQAICEQIGAKTSLMHPRTAITERITATTRVNSCRSTLRRISSGLGIPSIKA
ncbi:hypothetical protein GGQ10_000930 [Salinibacter ruber]|uniref:sulfotransferase family protein n=1 Tax=Salinibacter ruber TaxID=146919 RepID=UPI0021679C9B|nr:sulfotransferase family protein [Salinibacter ruber]MCS4086131.1 hypothetical protein [Salinibacter ruber]